MTDISELIADMKQKRDELKLQLHLASKEAEDEWEDLTGQWDKFLSRAQLEKSGDEIGEAAKDLGMKMKDAYERLRKASD